MNYFDYDTNLSSSFWSSDKTGEEPMHSVIVTLGNGRYRKQIEVDIGGNCLGKQVLESAIDAAFESVMDGNDHIDLVLTDPDGSDLYIELFAKYPDGEEPDYQESAECVFENMVIGAQIVDYYKMYRKDAKK